MPVYFDLLLLNQLYLSKREFRAAFLRHHSNFRGRILDIGCGIKPFKQFLKGNNYIGLEIKPGKKPDVCSAADCLPFSSESFDTVLCTEVLEHVPEPSRVLSECYRVINEGGKLYITVPMTWYLHYEPHDYYRFTKYGIRYLCEKAGFNVVEIERFGGLTMYMCLRMSEFLHTILYRYVFSPLKICGSRNKDIRKKLATIVLIPYQLIALVMIALFDRFSPLDARGWVVLAVKPAGKNIHTPICPVLKGDF